MSITINVGSIDPRTEKVHVYKAVTAHLNQLTPGTPWRTLTPTEAAQPVIDDDYPANTYVAYRIGVEYQGSINVGPEVVIGTWAETGYGPQELIRGDMSWGFFGKFDATEFITSQDISVKLGYAALAQVSWFKCAYEGRIIYIPSADNITMSPSTLHAKGAMYGMDAKGPAGFSSLPTVPQTATMQFDGRSYRLRLPRLDDYPTSYGTGALPGSEAGMFMALCGGANRSYGFTYSKGRILSLDGVSRTIYTSHMANTNTLWWIATNGGFGSTAWVNSTALSLILEYAPGV